MTHALHAIVDLIPAWPSATRLFTAAGRATGNALRGAQPWQVHSGRVDLPRVSSQWLRELEITSTKRQDE